MLPYQSMLQVMQWRTVSRAEVLWALGFVVRAEGFGPAADDRASPIDSDRSRSKLCPLFSITFAHTSIPPAA